MTDNERLCTALALSLFVHFMLFTSGGHEEERPPTFHTVLRLDMDSVATNPMPRQGLGVSSPTKQAQEAARLADIKRKAFLGFLEDVDAAVHARRLKAGEADLIGVVEYSFLVLPDGRFSSIELRASSGRPNLDAAALRAIKAASAVVKRPPLLGTEPIPVILQVKYQYNLQ